MVTVELSEKMRSLLAGVGEGLITQTDDPRADYLGTLKRYGLAAKSRDENGDHWTLTDAGKAYVGVQEGSGAAPEAPDGSDAVPEAEAATEAESTPEGP